MRRTLTIVAGLAAAASVALAASEPKLSGYLSPDQVPKSVLGPPPAEGSPQDVSDRQTFLATRSLLETGRWALAQEDADVDPRGASRLFDCALGARLEQKQPSAMTRLMTRMLLDVVAAANAEKAAFHRARPLVGNDQPICVARDKELLGSSSYPSAHAALGQAWSLALAQAEPDRADQILARGQAIGDSRVVCGVHYPSDVAAGRLVGAAVFAAQRQSPEFLADLAAAKAEIDARRAQGLPVPICAAESEALSNAVY
jgi:acid phosphatase (class A)